METWFGLTQDMGHASLAAGPASPLMVSGAGPVAIWAI